MKRHEYIKNQANELHRLHTKRLKVSGRILKGDLSPKQYQKLDAEWHPSGWHSYKGIREELEKTELE